MNFFCSRGAIGTGGPMCVTPLLSSQIARGDLECSSFGLYLPSGGSGNHSFKPRSRMHSLRPHFTHGCVNSGRNECIPLPPSKSIYPNDETPTLSPHPTLTYFFHWIKINQTDYTIMEVVYGNSKNL